MLARQLAYITYVRGSMSTLQIHLFLCFYEFMPPTLSREEPYLIEFLKIMRIDTLLQITLSSAFISESILEGSFDFYPVIMKNMNFADSALC